MSEKKPRNVKTAMVMLSIALVFFAGVIVNRYMNPLPETKSQTNKK
jgi:hypothetical protein